MASRNPTKVPILLVLPCVVALLAITIGPMIYAFNTSLHRYYLPSPKHPFIGFQNYLDILLRDPRFWNAFRIMIYYGVGAVAIEFVLGFIIALFLNEEFRGRRILSGVFMVPIIITPIVVGFTWRLMYKPTIGILNYFLRSVYLPESKWIFVPSSALLSLIIIDVWEFTPFMTLILLSGLMSLPREPLEAARIDGANSWQCFREIIFPLMKPIIMFAILFRLIDAFKWFDTIYVTTVGGPGTATETLSIYIYKKGLTWLYMGKAAAMSIMFLIFMIVLGNIIIKWANIKGFR